MWEAVETNAGVYNYTYLEEINNLINKLGKRGIYTMIDAHQDSFARRLCGEGIPNFYAIDSMLSHSCVNSFVEKMLGLFGFCKPFVDFEMRHDSLFDPFIEDCNEHYYKEFYYTPEV